jgi:hypothetical protein
MKETIDANAIETLVHWLAFNHPKVAFDAADWLQFCNQKSGGVLPGNNVLGERIRALLVQEQLQRHGPPKPSP